MTSDSSRTVADLALIATFAALIAVCSVSAALPIGINGVPMTLQTFAVLLCGAVLGARRGFLAVLLYLVVGAAGLPVFAAGTAGLAPFASPTAGYLIAFPFAAAAIGAFAGRGSSSASRTVTTLGGGATILAGGLLAEVIIYLGGASGFMVTAQMSSSGAFAAAALYIPGDLVKLFAVAMIAAAVHRAFPALAQSART